MSRFPALIILAALVAEIFCFEKIPTFFLPFVAGVVVILLCFVFRSRANNNFAVAVSVSATAFFCAFFIALRLSAPVAETVRVDSGALVSDVRVFGRYQAVVVKTDGGNFVLKRPLSEEYKRGEILRISGWTKKFGAVGSSPAVGSSFREDLFWRSRGVNAQILTSKIERAGIEKFSLSAWRIPAWRQKLHDSFNAYPKTMQGYLNAMWTGIRDDELQERHRIWGTSHLLAVSGFHVGIIVWLASAILFFMRGAAWRAIAISIFLWLYVLFAGAAPSAVRAALMFQVGIFASLLGRPVRAVNSVAVAGVLMLLYSPFVFWDVGWQLSMVAALTITGRGSLFFLITTVVFITTYPISAAIFGGVPLAGLIVNLIAVPFFAFAFPFLSLSALFGIFPQITNGALVLFGKIADFIAYLVPYKIGYNALLAVCCAAVFVWVVVDSE